MMPPKYLLYPLALFSLSCVNLLGEEPSKLLRLDTLNAWNLELDSSDKPATLQLEITRQKKYTINDVILFKRDYELKDREIYLTIKEKLRPPLLQLFSHTIIPIPVKEFGEYTIFDSYTKVKLATINVKEPSAEQKMTFSSLWFYPDGSPFDRSDPDYKLPPFGPEGSQE
jgi:hypothetical protein